VIYEEGASIVIPTGAIASVLDAGHIMVELAS
jgi:hypothetical protein